MNSTAQDVWIGLPEEASTVLRVGASRAAERIIAAIRSEVPAYNQPLRGRFGQVVRAAVEAAIQRFIEMIEQDDPDALETSRPVFFDLGRGEFREGRSLYELLRAYEVGALVALREIKADCIAAGVDPEVVYALAEAVLVYVTKLSAASSDGYSTESALAVEVTQAARDDLVKLLTARPPPSPAQIDAAARRARYQLPERIAPLACAVGEPAELAARVGPGTIGARIAGLACVLVPDSECEDTRLGAALNGADASLGPTVSLQSVPQSWEWARRALELAQSGAIDQRGLVHAEHHLATLLLCGDRSLVEALVARRLGPLAAAPSGNALSVTLLAWLSYHADIGRVADQLHVHPNTVRYRLKQVRQLYGDELDDPDACFELQLALRASGVRVPREEDA